MFVRSSAPVAANVGDTGDPSERCAIEGGGRPHDVIWEIRALVVGEDLDEDLRWDTASHRERVAAGANCA